MFRTLLTRSSLPLVPALALSLAAAGSDLAGQDLMPMRDWQLEAPNQNWVAGVIRAHNGFHLHNDTYTLLGDALRWNQHDQVLFATGSVVLVQDGVRLSADHLGFNHSSKTGDAWNVRLVLQQGERRLRITADHCHISPQAWELTGIHADGGLGSLFGTSSSSMRISMRPEKAPDRSGFEQQVAAISASHTRVEMAGIPIFYTPWFYRDYRLDYPWSHYEIGRDSRLGGWVVGHYKIPLPAFHGWRGHIGLRGDFYHTGHAALAYQDSDLVHEFDSDGHTAAGFSGHWQHQTMGHGSYEFYYQGHEDITHDGDDVLAVTNQQAVDADHQFNRQGFSFYGRYTAIPDADPNSDKITGSEMARYGHERFRNDYLADQLHEKPIGSQSLNLAFSQDWGTISANTNKRTNDLLAQSDRLLGLQVHSPGWQLFGPLHVNAELRFDAYRQEWNDTEADRLLFQSDLTVNEYMGAGLLWDAQMGIRGYHYENGQVNGLDTEDAYRRVLFAESGLRWRINGDFESGLQHSITPRLALTWLSEGHGGNEQADGTPPLIPYSFDGLDSLEEDDSILTAGIETSFFKDRLLLSGELTARWSLSDKTVVLPADADPTGDLIDIVANIEGHPTSHIGVTINGTFSGPQGDWSRFDGLLTWQAHERIALEAQATWVASVEHWQYRPGIKLVGNRYTWESRVTFDMDKHIATRIAQTISRRMVDGLISLEHTAERSERGDEFDHSYTLGFSIIPYQASY